MSLIKALQSLVMKSECNYVFWDLLPFCLPGFPSIMDKNGKDMSLLSLFLQHLFFFSPSSNPFVTGRRKKSADQSNSHKMFSHGEIDKVSKPIPLGVCWFSLRAMQPTFLPCLTGLKLCLGCNKFQPFCQSSSCSLIQLRDI